MATGQVGKITRHLRRALLLRDGAGLTDGQLLDCFINRRDEAAFEALVRRHGPMVMGVCRRALHNRHDAEDAFQATFLVLVRKAASIASPQLLANWLYGVACNTALKAKAAAARRRRRERQVTEMPEPEAVRPELWVDLQPLLDQELSRLPDKYRAPLVLCDLEGKTRKEAARRLGWPEGTLSGRLARARAMLAGRLARRGVSLSGGLMAAVLVQNAQAGVPASVLISTVRAASLLAAGKAATGAISAKVAALAEGVVEPMLTAKRKVMSGLLLAVTVLAAGTGGVAGLCHLEDQRAAAKAPDRGDIDRLIRQLDSEEFSEREAASKALEGIGEPALEALRKVAADRVPLETRKRAEELIRRIERRWELRCFTGHTDAVSAAALSPDGRLALSAGRSESSPRLWDVATGKELRRFEGHTVWVWGAAFSPDGKRALSAGVDGIRLWDVETGKELRAFTGHERQVYRVVFSSDGKRALSGSQDGTARLWDVETGQELRCFGGHADEVSGVALSPDGKQALSGSLDDTTRLWDVETGKELRRFAGAWVAVFSPDGKRVLSGGRDKVVRLWDVETGKELRRYEGHTKAVGAVAFSPDGKRALSGSDDATIRLWDVETGKELRCFKGHTAEVSSVIFSPDGKRALSASYDQTLRLWELPK